MASAHLSFTLPVAWDRAVIALDRAIAQGRAHLQLVDRGNGYWHLHAGSLTVHIGLSINTPTSTLIWLVAKRRGFSLFSGGGADRVLSTVREDVERALDAA